MPAMANITIKNAANADVVWVAAVPSSGEKSPAIWRFNANSDKLQFRPSFHLTMKENGRSNGRIFSAEFKFPLAGENSDTGTPFLYATIPFNVSGTLPTNVDVATLNDAFVQFGNLLVSTLIRSAAAEGYAPT
jgi:hypothetical protein